MQVLERIEKSISHWYAPLISGIIFIGAGILALVFGKATFIVITFLFSLSLLLSGVLEIVVAVVNRKAMTRWGWSLVFGMIDSIFGVLLLVNPFMSAVALALFVGFAVLFRSIGGIILAINLKKIHFRKWGYLLALSIFGVLFSFALILDPVFVWIAIIVFAAITLIAGGIFSIILSVFLKKMNRFEN